MTAWVVAADITTRWRDGVPPSDALITTQIDDILDFILTSGGTDAIIQARIDAGVITTNTVKRVIALAIIRYFQSPQNERILSWSESAAGTFSQNQSLSGTSRSNSPLTEAELYALIGRRSGKASIGSIFVVGTGLNSPDSFAYNI